MFIQMPKRKTLKQTITEAVLAELPEIQEPIDKILFHWWYSANSGDSLRLTDMGDMNFRLAEIEYYQCPLKTNKKQGYYAFITDLSNKINCPYYLGVNKVEGQKSEPYIRLYDSKIAMMMTLYGDIHSYLDSIKVRK